MNNKGQSLILFVLIIPLIFLILVFVYDIGNMILLKLELDNINKLTLDYGITNINNENINNELRLLIEKNKKDINYIDINIDNDKIYITLLDTVDTKIDIIKDISIFEIKSSYVGYLSNGKKMIERNK